MLIYRDIFTNDEMASDSFPMKVVDDVIYEFRGKFVKRAEGDIKLDGANESAEEPQADDYETAVTTGIDIVLNHSLQNMKNYESMKQFKDYIKEYMKKLADKMKENGKTDDDIAEWKKKMQVWVVALLKKERFKTLEFYSGAGEEAADGQLAILEYREEDGTEVPTVMLVKEGILVEKF